MLHCKPILSQVWVVKPELRQRYSLAEEVPEDIQAALAASVKAPKRKLGAFMMAQTGAINRLNSSV